MKLLLDNNLSPRLAERLADDFPGIAHVAPAGLERATDLEVWRYAKENGYAIVTKDADFNDFGAVFGFPPKVIRLRAGNCTTARIEKILRENRETVLAFGDDPVAGMLTLV